MSAQVRTVARRGAAELQDFDGSPSSGCSRRKAGARVDVWVVELDQPDGAILAASSILSEEELERASLGSTRVRRRRTLRRAALRTVLGSYLGRRPETVQFAYGAFGKPVLADVESSVRFNASASGDCCLIAVTTVGPIGVDVERFTELESIDQLAARFFAPAEAATISRLVGEQKLRSFYNCWTRSEAYVKALGCGLSSSLDRFVVSVEDGEPPAILVLEDDDPRAWALAALRPRPDYIGALALRTGAAGSSIAVRTWTLR
jgi:4'-phosphopantetheinyl transferase